MYTQESNGRYFVKTSSYALTITANCIDFIVAGEVLAGLRPVSAVNTCGKENKVTDDAEMGQVKLSASIEHEIATYIWESSSSLWEKKEYIVRCFETHFEYSVRVTGRGAVDTVNYFSGNLSEGKQGSMYEFDMGFTPIVTVTGQKQCYFSAMESQEVFSYLMIPPMFVYSFSTPGVAPKIAFGLAADRGEHNFTQFNYKTHSDANRRRFWFWTDQSGHTVVNGTWETPRVLCYVAESDMAALKVYSDYYFTAGLAKHKSPGEKRPRFWYGPMTCGWLEQYAYGNRHGGKYTSYAECTALACEEVYRNLAKELQKKKLYPKIMIIDDKWQNSYGDQYPNKDQWPDLRAFIDENRDKNGIYTMLWFKLWDAEGLEEDMCMWDPKENRRVADPTNPKYRERLKAMLYHLLSSDEGCCNAYGLKLDYAFWQPVGRGARSYSGKYGVELFLELISYIYRCVKEIKPEAVVNCSPCHPLFVEFCDQARLHDYYIDLRRCYEEFSFRKEVYEIAMPDVLFDTDGAAFSSYRDTMRYMRLAPTLGIPDLYCISPMPSLELSADDWDCVSKVWAEYDRRIDRMFE